MHSTPKVRRLRPSWSSRKRGIMQCPPPTMSSGRKTPGPGVFRPDDMVGGGHCMIPRFLEDQLGRSLRTLGVECIDVYYLHNPETQLGEISRPDFNERMLDAFAF